MYATPVVYPMSFLLKKSQTAASFLKWNPMSPIVEGFRYCFFHLPKQQFQFASLGYSFAFMVVVLLIGMSLFNKVEKGFMDTV
jgi:lipopolysaccharide transport system permease protein